MNSLLGKKKERVDEDHEINVTPLLDVVFIMLIFFIVTASFVKEWGISPNYEQSDSNVISESESQDIIFNITATNEIWLNNRRIDLRAIRANIERMYAENPKAKVIVKAADEAETGVFVTVIDSAREAGVYDVAFSTTGR
jgi:biopolymer transport protein ExbD